MSLLGRRFRSLVRDISTDENSNIILHPRGSIFKVVEALHREEGEQMYAVAWEDAYSLRTGEKVTSRGMWTIWSETEITKNAEPVEGSPPLEDGGGKDHNKHE